MRRLIGRRLRDERRLESEHGAAAIDRFVDDMRAEPVAVAPGDANEQHYELPTEFFATVLGPHLKYSSGLWTDDVRHLAQAEERMLELSCQRAGLEDGMEVLDLGCGWGSLTLWIARHYPGCRVLAVSNSATQAEFIRGRCAELGTDRVEVVTDRRFDRVMSVEMFEHMRNWSALFERVAGWLEPDGAFFQHVFCHRRYAYLYLDEGDGDWMTRYFFTGGIMPSEDLPRRYPEHLEVEGQWTVDGDHYSRTLEAWLDAMDRNREMLLPVFEATYGADADRWWGRWRMFFMACSELFRYRGGREWYVVHTLMRPRGNVVAQ
jgi:cyclopropane-fatty-acyl-phospholipid synthase